MTPEQTIDSIHGLLRSYNFVSQNERELQDALQKVLQEAGFAVSREVRLDARNRIDFVVFQAPHRVGIEVKVDGSNPALVAQVQRYCQVDQIDAVLVVATRHRLGRLPREMAGKPVRVHLINPAFH